MNPATSVVDARPLATSQILSGWTAFAASRAAEYLSIAKPRIALMVLVTVGVGYFLASQEILVLSRLLHAALGITLASTAASALNQFIERDTDRRMARTRHRALPSGRISPAEILIAGLLLAAFSTLYLLFTVNITTALLTLASIVVYSAVYTPLKRYTAFCTAIGAIPGALPPVLGWTAAGGEMNAAALALFAIVFVWQFPHFLAIAWLYRDQYSAAGLRMLPANGRGRMTGWLAFAYALCLIPVGLLPTAADIAGQPAGLVSVVLGIIYAAAAFNFLWNESRESAKMLIWTSLMYLPTMFLAISVDHWRLLR